MTYTVRHSPPRGALYHSMHPALYGDWQMHEGATMDAPGWLPAGSAAATGAHLIGGATVWVDSGHILREGST